MMDRERGLPCLPGEFNDLIRTKRFTNDEPETGPRSPFRSTSACSTP